MKNNELVAGKFYLIKFTNDIEVTFYDRNYNDTTKLCKENSTRTAKVVGMNKNNFVDLIIGANACSIPRESFIAYSLQEFIMKQVTVMVHIAITMEVPSDMTTEALKDMVRNDTTWDVTCDNHEIVEVSDILAVNSISEAPLSNIFT